MAMTAAERQRKRRQKLKEKGYYEDYRAKNKLEAQNSRKKKKEKILKLPKSVQAKINKEARTAIKIRVAKCRALKKQNTAKNNAATNYQSPYKNSSSLGKAIARAKRALPSTPRRKKAVIRRLFQTEINSRIPSDQNIKHSRVTALAQETAKLVQEFYEQDDISRQAPGRRDVVTVILEDGTKIKKQTRHLQSSLKEIHQMFLNENPNIKVGKSMFAALRPKHVLLSRNLPHSVCMCKYHQNFISALDDLHKQVPEIPKYSNDFPDTLLCDKKSICCWMNACTDCKDGSIFMKKYGDVPNVEYLAQVTWHQWKKIDNGRLCNVIIEGTVDDLVNYIHKLVPTFLEHCHVKREQAKVYKQQRAEATSDRFDETKALIQMDFSENYTCVSQDEIQSAHWAQSQVSLFTVAAWHGGVLHSEVMVSDDLTHSKDTVLPYVDKLLSELPPEIEEVNIWTDGPNSQFKNKFIAASLPAFEKKHRMRNFFASAHGKGSVDGIGGSVKRQVWDAVRKRKQIVYNATDFVKAAKASSNIKVVEIAPNEIQDRAKELNLSAILENAAPLEGIMKLHFLHVVNGHTVGQHLSILPCVPPDDIHMRSEVGAGDWYEVLYDGELYPGEVKEVGDSDYLVSVMVRAGKYWKWPDPLDEIYYLRESLIRKLDPPEAVNARGHFQFKQLNNN